MTAAETEAKGVALWALEEAEVFCSGGSTKVGSA